MILHEPVWHAIFLVADSDAQAANCLRTIEQIKQTRATLHTQQISDDASLHEAHQKYTALRTELRNAQQELAMLEQREKSTKLALAQTTCAKTCLALEHEYAQLLAQRTMLDDQVMHHWYAVEEEEQILKTYQSKHTTDSAARLVKLAELDQQEQALMHEYEQARQTSQTAQANIGPALLEQYRHIGAHMTNPLVVVTNESCPQCYTSVPSQDMCALKRCQIVLCKGCFRMLFLPLHASTTPPTPTP